MVCLAVLLKQKKTPLVQVKDCQRGKSLAEFLGEAAPVAGDRSA
jgi:hypothetical protein